MSRLLWEERWEHWERQQEALLDPIVRRNISNHGDGWVNPGDNFGQPRYIVDGDDGEMDEVYETRDDFYKGHESRRSHYKDH